MEPTLEQKRNRLAAIGEEEQQKLADQDPENFNSLADAAGFSTIIDSTALQPTPSLDFIQPESTQTYTAGEPPELQLTKPEEEAQAGISEIQKLTQQLTGESTFRAEEEKTRGLEGLEKTQLDLSNQLKALAAEEKAIPIQLQQESEGRGITKGGLAPIQAGRLRENAIRALGVSSLLSASQGNLALAQQQIDRAVSNRFDPLKAERAAKIENLNLLIQSPAYSLADKNRAQKQLAFQQKQQRELGKQEDNAKIAQTMAAAAVKLYSGDQRALLAAQQVQKLNPADPAYLQKVYQLVGQYQADPAEIQKDLDAHLLAQQKLEAGVYDIEQVKEQLKNAPFERRRLQAQIEQINADTSLTPFKRAQLEADTANTYSQIAERDAKIKELNAASSVETKQSATAELLNLTNGLLQSPYIQQVFGAKKRDSCVMGKISI